MITTKKYTFVITDVADSDEAQSRVDQAVKKRKLEEYDYDYDEESKELTITWTQTIDESKSDE